MADERGYLPGLLSDAYDALAPVREANRAAMDRAVEAVQNRLRGRATPEDAEAMANAPIGLDAAPVIARVLVSAKRTEVEG